MQAPERDSQAYFAIGLLRIQAQRLPELFGRAFPIPLRKKLFAGQVMLQNSVGCGKVRRTASKKRDRNNKNESRRPFHASCSRSFSVQLVRYPNLGRVVS